MKATLEKKEANTATLNIEVDVETVEKHLERAYRKIVRRVSIPGFRKGKAPRRMVERHYGKAVLWDEALEDILEEAYGQALEQTGIEPVDTPKIDIVSMEDGEPLAFTATVEVMPEVELGDYKSIRLQKEEKEITDEDIEKELEAIRDRNAQLVTVEDGEVAEGLFAVIDFKGYLDGEPFEGGEADGYLLEIGSGTFIEGFEEQLVGMKPYETRRIKVTFPEDYGSQELAGREAEFEVTVREVKRKELPELDDQLAKDEGYESLEELRRELTNKLRETAARETRRDLENRAVEAAVEQVTLDLPEAMIHRQIHVHLDDLRRQIESAGLSYQQWLEATGRTDEQMHDEFREQAIREVKAQLVMDAIARAEGIEVSDAEVEEEVDKTAAMYGQSAEAFKSLLLSEENREGIRANLRRRKAIEWLAGHAVGETTAAGEPEAASEPDTAETGAAAEPETTGTEASEAAATESGTEADHPSEQDETQAG